MLIVILPAYDISIVIDCKAVAKTLKNLTDCVKTRDFFFFFLESSHTITTLKNEVDISFVFCQRFSICCVLIAKAVHSPGTFTG
jgi:hypothetical protein